MAYEVPPLPYDYDALEPHIDEADDGDPPRQAPPGVRGQGQRRARGHRLRRQADRGGPQEPRRAPVRQAEGRPQQRRRPLQPLAVLGVDEPGRRRRARRRPRRGDRRRVRLLRGLPGEVQGDRRQPVRLRLGLARPRRLRPRGASARPTRTTRSPTARRRCWASTSGSTPTTSSTRTSAPTTSTPGGTPSTGRRSPRATPRPPDPAGVLRGGLHAARRGRGAPPRPLARARRPLEGRARARRCARARGCGPARSSRSAAGTARCWRRCAGSAPVFDGFELSAPAAELAREARPRRAPDRGRSTASRCPPRTASTTSRSSPTCSSTSRCRRRCWPRPRGSRTG